MLALLSDWLYHSTHNGQVCTSTASVLIARSSDGKHNHFIYLVSLEMSTLIVLAIFNFFLNLFLLEWLPIFSSVLLTREVQRDFVSPVKSGFISQIVFYLGFTCRTSNRGQYFHALSLVERNVRSCLCRHVHFRPLFSYDPKGCVILETSVCWVFFLNPFQQMLLCSNPM